MKRLIALGSLVILTVAACASPTPTSTAAPAKEVVVPEQAKLEAAAAQYAPTDIGADISKLGAGEQQALALLVRAGWVMDGLFLRQVWAGNEGLLLNLLSDQSPLGKARTHYLLINKGPWDRLDRNIAFIAGVPSKPEGANFYPAGATKEEIDAWLKTLPEAERVRAAGFFTTIRRPLPAKGARPGFEIVPYSIEYQGELARAAELLREAAAATTQPTLKTFLNSRAEAFLSNDYYASDVAWMELDSSIEPTIGPYEVYEDEWFNAKAAFEAFIAVRDDGETAKLARLGAELQGIEDNLPIDPALRNPKLGGMAPIRVVNVILASGDGNRGVQTSAFNLPNDERVVREKGAKRVMLRNIQEAKFNLVLRPIAARVLSPAQQKNVTFDAFFTHTVMHELMHGLGPHQITVGGRSTTVRAQLKEAYSAIEEAKADISGLFALQRLLDKGVLDKSMQETIYDTYLASAFRAIRFGVTEAHGRGIALQLNWLLDDGAITVGRDGAFAIDQAKIRDGVTALTREIMMLQAAGDYAKASDMLTRLAVVRPEVRRVLDKLSGVPVDIEPRFTTAAALLAKHE
jgi:Peptidase family M49